ncbi:ribonuclease R [Methylogaea oryzae]|uniref:Ribonuclease R n=2 Tax=Methylogaea oryzae TaxID=1295382 RepID=A0A8D4VSB2_9GAMM|nr:ribonuclease R [Methylogaea oryzae]BBL71667.1 ribonuclease R [Methylogaea oryzae]
MNASVDETANSFPYQDPYAEREAQKYAKPIPSRELILQVLEEGGAPAAFGELAEKLGVTDEEDLVSLQRRVNAMERDGQLLKNRRDLYCVVDQSNLVVGRVIGHPDGFGFLRPDDGSEDLFLSPREMRVLMHDDRVMASIRGVDRRGRPEGGVVEVLERNTHRVVGRLFMEGGIATVVPDSKHITHDILVPAERLNGAQPGQIVVIEIVEQPSRHNQPIGQVLEVLGEHMAPGLEIEIAIRSHDLPNVWPAEVEQEVAGLSPTVEEAAKQGRVDLRPWPLVTIDGEDARDFDDAVYCERQENGWRLLVAIADVSHYVKPGTALDLEAQNRGNSVYFPERVIPMLPEILSNGLCSINPHEDRLCMVCDMLVNEDGEVTFSTFYDAVMLSHARLTYNEVAAILDGDPELRQKRYDLLPHLEDLHALYQALRARREQRGAIDFETQETKIVFGEQRKIERIVPVVRNDAHKLIEECMIMANMAAAEFLKRYQMPHILRVHEGPSPTKIGDLRSFLGEVGLQLLGGDEPEPRHYVQMINQIKGRPDEHLIQTVLLRSLSQAVYSPEEKGHFGLALESYTHFTSPIRRYPDLLVHRAIRHVLQGRKPEEFVYSKNDMVLMGEQCSSTERRADEATRDVVSWLKCEYMQSKLGETFEGVISAVTPFGLFIELKDIYVEGLVHISTLGSDYFHFDPVGRRLQGERSGLSYRLGDTVSVIVARVDLDEKKVDFEMVQVKPQKAAAGEGRRSAGAGKPRRRRGGKR